MKDGPRIFISYRRDSSASYPAHSVARDLKAHYGRDRVFVDVDAIPFGEDFLTRIHEAVDRSHVVMVFIGPDWLSVPGHHDIMNAEDFVRLEVRRALERSIPVLPILVDSAGMPAIAQLPEDISALSRRNARSLPADRVAREMPEIIADIDRLSRSRRTTRGADGLASRPSGVRHIGPSSVPDPGALAAQLDGDAGIPGSLLSRWPDLGTFRDRLPDGKPGPIMRVIPAGSFYMGSPDSDLDSADDERPRHEVVLASAFAIGQFAVTFEEFDGHVQATGRVPPTDEGWGRGTRPVVGVSWHEATRYTKWLADLLGRPYRLPSEAEWEYCARAGTTTRFPWGDDPGHRQGNFDESGSEWSSKMTAPVDAFAANPFGLFQMSGNVWEWVEDTWHNSYDQAPSDGTAWLSGDQNVRMLRGGTWFSPAFDVRCACRHHAVSTNRYGILGFRVACSMPAPAAEPRS